MKLSGGMNDLSEMSDVKRTEGQEISKEARDKIARLMGDDKIRETSGSETIDRPKLSTEEREHKLRNLFAKGGFFEKKETVRTDHKLQADGITDNIAKKDTGSTENRSFPELANSDIREPRSIYEYDGNKYETDDNGQTYKKNAELFPDTEYNVNGNVYRTNEYGKIVSCDADPKYTEEGLRNMKEQKESGGEERQADDDGGHIVARILGGAEGEENLVPMRRTINRGDYKRMENEISKAIQEDKKGTLHVDLEYDGDSSRPSKFQADYTIDGKETVCEFDNVEGSTDLLESLDNKISDGDCERLKQTLKEMKEDGCDAAITSVKTEYDESGNPTKITVGILNESTSTKTYKGYAPR